MLRHIVLFRMDANTDDERATLTARLSGALAALPAQISQIRELTLGTNVLNRPGNWDLVLTVDVDDVDALDEYRAHPEHQKVVQLIDAHVADRCAVDVAV